MNIRKSAFSLVIFFVCAWCSISVAQNQAPHAGQMDTDGILSPGERENPHIDYRRSQVEHERHGDDRVDNPDNDDAADRDSNFNRGHDQGYRRDEDRDYHHERERDYREDERSH